MKIGWVVFEKSSAQFFLEKKEKIAKKKKQNGNGRP